MRSRARSAIRFSASRRGASPACPSGQPWPHRRTRRRDRLARGYDRLTPHEACARCRSWAAADDSAAAVAAVPRRLVGAQLHRPRARSCGFSSTPTAPPRSASCTRSGGDFEGAYGKSLAHARGRVARDDQHDRAAADVVEGTRERFRGGSVFARPCPHAIAARARASRRGVGERQSRRRDSTDARVCNDAPDEPRYQLELGDFLIGGIRRRTRRGDALWTTIADSADARDLDAARRCVRAARAHAAAADDCRDDAGSIGKGARAAASIPNARRQLEADGSRSITTGRRARRCAVTSFRRATPIDPPTWALIAVARRARPWLWPLPARPAADACRGDWQQSAIELDYALARGLPGRLVRSQRRAPARGRRVSRA